MGPSPERSGGIATWIRLVRGGLIARGLQPRVFATDKPRPRTAPLPLRLAGGATMAARFRRYVHEDPPAVAHICCGSGWGLREAGVLARVAKGAGSAAVIHLHAASLFERMDRSPADRRWSLAALSVADRVAVLGPRFVSGLAARGFLGAVVVPNGVPVPQSVQSTPPPSIPLRILLLGSVEDRKGLQELIGALEGLTDDERARLTVRWCGPILAPSDQVERGRRAGICFVGSVSAERVEAELVACHGVLLPSHREGLPFAVLEAMARSRPVIASSVGALPDLLEAESLVPPGDVGALQSALRGWLSDPADLVERGRKSRVRVQTGNTLIHTLNALESLWSPWLARERR